MEEKIQNIRRGRIVTLHFTGRRVKVLDRTTGSVKVCFIDEEPQPITFIAPGTLVRVGGKK